MEPSVRELLSGSDHGPDARLLRSFSHESDSLESDTAVAPVSDLYIYESETQDFLLSSHVEPHDFQCPPGGTGAENPACDPHFPMCDSDNAVTRRHRSSSESDVGRHARPPVPDACGAGSASVNDGRRGNAEAVDLTPRARRSNSPTELWLDACQYLAGEDTEDWKVLDKTRYPVTQAGLASQLSFPPGDARVSGCNHDGGDGIGWSSDDTRGWGPPVERWSSVDSWASALSDWTGIIAAPPADFTAAFTEIGAEIDALTQALAEVKTHLGTEAPAEGKGQEPAVPVQPQPPMGVQDWPLEAQNLPESSILSEQSSVGLEASGAELPDREGTRLCEEKEAEVIRSDRADRPAYQHSSMGSSGEAVASPGGHGAGAIPAFTHLNPSHFEDFVESDLFISGEGDQIILKITEDTDLEGQNTPGDLTIEMPFGGEVCEVTDGHGVSTLRSLTEQEVKRSSWPAEVNREGAARPTELHPHDTLALTNSHVPGVRKQPGSHVNVRAHVSSDTRPDLDGAGRVEPQRGGAEFIMPLAPLGHSALSALDCRTNRRSEGDRTSAKRSLTDGSEAAGDHMQTTSAPWPTVEGVTDVKSLEGEELIHKKGNRRKSAVKSSPEGLNLIRKTTIEEIHDLSRDLSNLADFPAERFIVSERNRVAFITLDINDPFVSRAPKSLAEGKQSELNLKTAEKMPHKTHKSTSESKARSKKDKTSGHYHGVQACKKQESFSHHVSAQQVCKQPEAHPLVAENHTSENTQGGLQDKEDKLATEAVVATEKPPSKSHGKKKKKHAPNATGVKSAAEPLADVENAARTKTAKGRIDMFEAKLGAKAGKAQKDGDQSDERKSQKPEGKAKASQGEQPPRHAEQKDQQAKKIPGPLNDDIIKRRRLSEDKFGKTVGVLESKLSKPDVSIQTKGEEPKVDSVATRKKAYSEVVKVKTPPKEEPKVLQPIQTALLSGDPQSLCLWCQFAAVSSQHTVTWSRDGPVLSESKRSAGDGSRASLTICNASHKDLGKYQCQLTSLHGSITLDYLLTYEALSEIVIPPPQTTRSAPVEGGSEEEDVLCSQLVFQEDFLSNQHFGENQAASIVTEKLHFGEGMHRRAFRTRMQTGRTSLVLPGHSCVLKVHTSISNGSMDAEQLIQKNFSLAVEECHVQNTAREYIKEYSAAAQCVDAFGQIPEIIPIYLVHRPSNDIPYATLEEELIGDFVKYSVKDGKEINLKRQDSEAGQKCCAFQHWVYHKTEGNLLVTDMQGVGMRLTDVGIATCKKGYKGFKGNCATSFIEQFKALHQCNMYCEILQLKSMQPKPKKPAPKPKAQPSAAKKKTFGPTVKGKS
ncbi:alpha-protein kinase 2 isoform X2 [Clinocottus analis]